MEENKVMTHNKLIVDGNEYLYEELEDDQKYAVTQIKNLNVKIAQTNFEMNQLKAAVQHFYLELSEALKNQKDPNQMELPFDVSGDIDIEELTSGGKNGKKKDK